MNEMPATNAHFSPKEFLIARALREGLTGSCKMVLPECVSATGAGTVGGLKWISDPVPTELLCSTRFCPCHGSTSQPVPAQPGTNCLRFATFPDDPNIRPYTVRRIVCRPPESSITPMGR